LFGLADVLIVTLAFQLAYWTRVRLELKHEFFLTPPVHAALLGWTLAVPS